MRHLAQNIYSVSATIIWCVLVISSCGVCLFGFKCIFFVRLHYLFFSSYFLYQTSKLHAQPCGVYPSWERINDLMCYYHYSCIFLFDTKQHAPPCGVYPSRERNDVLAPCFTSSVAASCQSRHPSETEGGMRGRQRREERKGTTEDH